MILKNEKRIIRHQYTIIELLVVLVIAGLLTGMSVSGIKGALARQGATGAVRTLATKISMAQSFAVSKNRYVALLVPDYNQVVINPTEAYVISDKTAANLGELWTSKYSSCFVKNRLCYVNKVAGVYEFDRWVDGYEWQTLPSKTIAFISEQGADSVPVQVTDIPDPTSPDDPPTVFKKSTALIFKPSGGLVYGQQQVIIRIFRAAYLAGDDGPTVFRWQGTEDENKGWKIVINGFTGRSRFYLGGETVDD
jgi:type II secretory pathway pseudopilin PulG